MSQIAERILTEALQLPEDERADVATKLYDSLDPESIEMDDAEWVEEIRKRVEDFRSGKVKGIPWSEARQLILEDTDDES